MRNLQLDIGPDTCAIFKITNFTFEQLVEFAYQDKGYVDKLYELLEEYKTHIQPNLHGQLVPFYVARWIHFTNKIEFAGFADEGDTRDLLLKRRVVTGSLQEKEVLQTFHLLQKTYSPNLDCVQRVSKFSKLRKWHKICFQDILDNNGHFRLGGAFAEPGPDHQEHIYPHHKVLKTAVGYWLNSCYTIARDAKSFGVPKAKLRYLFALAAFAQFHIVDIHPFADGNGRICRFVSKFILDEILPLPSMFENRQDYLSSLISGRSLPPQFAPQFLYQLLLQTAIATYTDVLSKFKSYTQVLCYFAVSTEEELQKELEKAEPKLEEATKVAIKNKFGGMGIKDTAVVLEEGKGVYKIFKSPSLQPAINLDEDLNLDDL